MSAPALFGRRRTDGVNVGLERIPDPAVVAHARAPETAVDAIQNARQYLRGLALAETIADSDEILAKADRRLVDALNLVEPGVRHV